MKFEVGKTYLDRTGEEVTIVGNDGHPGYPLVCDDGQRRTASGEFYSQKSAPDDRDLVAEAKPAAVHLPQPTPAPMAALVPRVWALLDTTVEDAVRYGYNRSHKHNDNPDEQAICTAIHEAVLTAVAEAFHVVEPREE